MSDSQFIGLCLISTLICLIGLTIMVSILWDDNKKIKSRLDSAERDINFIRKNSGKIVKW